jgi:iron-sulfur cluster assembly protein
MTTSSDSPSHDSSSALETGPRLDTSRKRGSLMLSLTQHAVSVVRKFTANPRLGESSGVRIAHQWSTRKLQVRPVRAPEPGDVVVEQTGGRVYVGPAAARKLRGKVLDARDDAEGRVEFLLKPAEQS